MFVKLTTASDQSIGKFQIKSGERARGVRTEKRETLFSKQRRWLARRHFWRILSWIEDGKTRKHSVT